MSFLSTLVEVGVLALDAVVDVVALVDDVALVVVIGDVFALVDVVGLDDVVALVVDDVAICPSSTCSMSLGKVGVLTPGPGEQVGSLEI